MSSAGSAAAYILLIECEYAHGEEELNRKKHINLHYKCKRCDKFEVAGYCNYGTRCQYVHSDDSYTATLRYYCEKLLLWKDKNLGLPLDAIMRKTYSFRNSSSIRSMFDSLYSLTETTESD